MGDSVNRQPSPAAVKSALIVGPQSAREHISTIRRLVIGLLDEPMVITLVWPTGEDAETLPCPPARLHRYATSRFRRFLEKTPISLAQTLVEAGVEVLHAFDVEAHELTRDLSERIDVPYLVSVERLGAGGVLGVPGPRCRGILAASDVIYADLLATRDLNEDLLSVVRPAVGMGDRRVAEVQPHRPVIFLTGAMEPVRPLAAVLRAVSALHRQGIDAMVMITRPCRFESYLRRSAARLDLTSDMTFSDDIHPDALPRFIQAADVLLCPIPTGAVETEALQAMAGGVPVVVGGACAGDFVEPGRTALLYARDNVQELVQVLRTVLDNHPPTPEIRAEAHQMAVERHTMGRLIRDLAERYREQALAGRTLRIS